MTADERTVKFGTLHEDGTVSDMREIKQASIVACPFFIMMFEHYREDGSCRCDDPEHTEMATWGYTWNNNTQRWKA